MHNSNLDPYRVVKRIDGIRCILEQGKPVNSNVVIEQFAVSWRTAIRDIKYLKSFYGDRLSYDYKDRGFYLDYR